MSTKIGGISPLQMQLQSRLYIGDRIFQGEMPGEVLDVDSSLFSPTSPLQLPSRRGLILPGMPDVSQASSRFSFPQEEQQPRIIKIPIDEIIEGLEALGREKTRMTFGFYPMPIHDEFEVKWGERALSIAHKLQDDLSSATMEEAIGFLGSSKMIEILRSVVKQEDRGSFGLNPTPISEESRSIVERASALSEKLLGGLSESTLQETVEFLESQLVSQAIKRLKSGSFSGEESSISAELS